MQGSDHPAPAARAAMACLCEGGVAGRPGAAAAEGRCLWALAIDAGQRSQHVCLGHHLAVWRLGKRLLEQAAAGRRRRQCAEQQERRCRRPVHGCWLPVTAACRQGREQVVAARTRGLRSKPHGASCSGSARASCCCELANAPPQKPASPAAFPVCRLPGLVLGARALPVELCRVIKARGATAGDGGPAVTSSPPTRRRRGPEHGSAAATWHSPNQGNSAPWRTWTHDPPVAGRNGQLHVRMRAAPRRQHSTGRASLGLTRRTARVTQIIDASCQSKMQASCREIRTHLRKTLLQDRTSG